MIIKKTVTACMRNLVNAEILNLSSIKPIIESGSEINNRKLLKKTPTNNVVKTKDTPPEEGVTKLCELL